MKMNRCLLFFLTTCWFFQSCNDPQEELSVVQYEANWDSLAQYNESPEWFKDAKFGIYCHWGVLSVPAFANDWHPRLLHIEGTENYTHHIENYGNHDEFGYHDFVPMFEADSFNAAEWADLYKKSGAKFAGLVAEHHDGWSNWDSDINPWNAVDKGPKRDIVGELEKEIHGRGMKFVTTFHMARNLQIYQADTANRLNDKSYFPYDPEMATSSEDPEIRMMYGNIPKEQFYNNWIGKLKEVISSYHPDLIYFDGELSKLPDSLLLQFATYYINESLKNNQPVVITHKNGELPKSVSLMDLEKGRMDDKTEFSWLTDETIAHGSWSYTTTMQVKPAKEIIHVLVDIVSKNGNLMLNISPKANGVIPTEQKEVLVQIGQWLEKYGEGIYGSRTWDVYGEGPTVLGESGHFLEWKAYSNEDVRFTTKNGNLYAFILGWPGSNKKVHIKSIKESLLKKPISNVSILGFPDAKVEWSFVADEFTFTTPEIQGDTVTTVLKFNF